MTDYNREQAGLDQSNDSPEDAPESSDENPNVPVPDEDPKPDDDG